MSKQISAFVPNYTCTESKMVQSKQLIAKPWPIVQQENVDAKKQIAGNYCIYLKQKLYNIGYIYHGQLPGNLPTHLYLSIYSPDISCGRASASGAVGPGFQSRPRHTESIKNGISSTLSLKGYCLEDGVE